MWIDIIYNMLVYACIVVLFVNAGPLIYFKEIVYGSIYGRYNNENKWEISDYSTKWHWRLINCCLCSGFYIGLIITHSLKDAVLISIISELISKNISSGKI